MNAQPQAQPTAVTLPSLEALPASSRTEGEELTTVVSGVLVATDKYIVEIKDPQTYAEAVSQGQQIAAKISWLKEKKETICSPLFKAHRAATGFFGDLIKPLENRLEAIETGTARYRVEQDRLRRLEEERRQAEERNRRMLNEAHDAAVAEDRQRREAFLRLWDEALSEDEDRARAKERAKEEAARLQHAQTAESVGNVDKVDRILEQPTPLAPAPVVLSAPAMAKPAVVETPKAQLPPPPAPVAPPPPLAAVPVAAPAPAFVPDIKGVVKSNPWRFKVVNKLKLLKAILEGNLPIDCVEINDGERGPIGEKVRKYGAKWEEQAKEYGIEMWQEAKDSIRAARGA